MKFIKTYLYVLPLILIGLLTSCDNYKVHPNEGKFFTKYFGGPSIDNGARIRSTKDGGYIIAGTSNNYAVGFTQAYIAKLDSRGNLEWQYALGDTTTVGTSVIELSSGGYILTANVKQYKGPGIGVKSNIVLYKFNALGTNTATRQYEKTIDETVNDLVEISGVTSGGANDGDILIVGSRDNRLYYARTTNTLSSTSLTEISFTTGNQTPSTEVKRIIRTNEAYYSLCQAGNEVYMGTLRLDNLFLNGATSSKIVGNNINAASLAVTSYNTIVGIATLEGNVILTSFQNGGEISASSITNISNTGSYLANGITVNGQYGFIGGTAQNGVNTDKLLLKVNLLTNTIENTYTYGISTSNQTCNDITSAIDGGLVLIGNTSVETSNTMIEVLKVKSDGTQVPD